MGLLAPGPEPAGFSCFSPSSPIRYSGFPTLFHGRLRRGCMAGPSLQALREMLRDLERSVETQVKAGESVDDKAYGVVRLDAVLLGLLFPAASLFLSWRSENGDAAAEIPEWPLWALFIGGILLVASMVLAIMEYRATKYWIGLKADDIKMALGYEIDEERHLHDAISAYVGGVDGNDTAFQKNVKLLNWSLFLLAGGVLLLTAAAGGLIGHTLG